MLGIIISTLVFFIAGWYFKRYLDEQGIPKGMTRGMLIFTLAALLSWGAGGLVMWAQEKIADPQVISHPSGAMSNSNSR